MRVLVFGASGVQGKAQVTELVRAGHQPVAVSRRPAPTAVDGTPVETAAADFSAADGAAAVDRVLATHGPFDAVFLNLPSTSFQPSDVVRAGARAVGEALQRAAAATRGSPPPLVVFNTSMPVPDTPQGIRAQDDRRAMRDDLRGDPARPGALGLGPGLGLPVISIQPVCYLENLLEGWALPPIVERRTVVYCHKPTLRASWISHIDVAKLMIAAMHRPDYAGRNFAVGGPETVRLAELTEKLSRGWGVPLACENQTVPAFCDAMAAAMRRRAALDVDRVIAQMHKAYSWYNDDPSDPFVVDMDAVLKELPVHAPLLTIEEWARLKPLPATLPGK